MAEYLKVLAQIDPTFGNLVEREMAKIRMK